MNALFKIVAIAAAFGLAPTAAMAQDNATAPAATAPDANAALPAQPQEASTPPLASGGAAPSDATVAKTAGAYKPGAPAPGVGQPDGRMGLQDQFTPIGEEAAWFHNQLLLPVITAISIFVLALLLYVIVRFRRTANPVPSRTTHNTAIEVIWTLVPVLILVVLAVPSIKLLARQYSPPAADLTVKVTGNQWYWTYSYPDNGDFELVSNMLPDEEAAKRGEPRLLAVDERMVVPAGATVKLIVTSADVIHAFAMPAFWTKMDAVPGRLNETWFKVDKPGVYYGQCSELCGARHAYMPIVVEVVPPAQFAAWVASKGGTMPGAAKPASPDATANSPIANPAPAAPTVGAGEADATTPAPTNVVEATTTPPVSRQGEAESKRGN
ncbi:cytochrome c oxidase subunit II [Allosphingosinicella flava]|uniref:Cytochrome c oxidase subunit 2 n=1 Tax=Allosphingosinicella flava TaxID=2771430 RepID=A0A7T2GID1_9SPHN|nr:cytochrome c oxidase subunit II [Sphingosinicella flava]QPQ54396.1 cytochrome c oxidase subunit II [Sphingosinicella flava]